MFFNLIIKNTYIYVTSSLNLIKLSIYEDVQSFQAPFIYKAGFEKWKNIWFLKLKKNNTYRDTKLIFSFIFDVLYWIKIRSSYALMSWIYTTNHKRIAVNYFHFVTLAGIAGMSLATVIRLEFAYPGVGVLAGDSLQYLSIATSHGVIMVFFMIIPLTLEIKRI